MGMDNSNQNPDFFKVPTQVEAAQKRPTCPGVRETGFCFLLAGSKKVDGSELSG